MLLSLPRVYPREKQAIAKLMTSMTVLYIFVSSMQIPSFQLRSAAERQSLWRAYQIPSIHQMKHLTQRATAYRWWPSGADAPDIFIISYSCWRGGQRFLVKPHNQQGFTSPKPSPEGRRGTASAVEEVCQSRWISSCCWRKAWIPSWNSSKVSLKYGRVCRSL